VHSQSEFVVYGGFVVGVSIAVPDARLACTVLLAAYLLKQRRAAELRSSRSDSSHWVTNDPCASPRD